jgi:hypothetical protein
MPKLPPKISKIQNLARKQPKTAKNSSKTAQNSAKTSKSGKMALKIAINGWK